MNYEDKDIYDILEAESKNPGYGLMIKSWKGKLKKLDPDAHDRALADAHADARVYAYTYTYTYVNAYALDFAHDKTYTESLEVTRQLLIETIEEQSA